MKGHRAEPLNPSLALNTDGSSIALRYIEDGEENACFLADEQGDREYARSRWFAADGTTVLPADNAACDMCGQKLPQARR